MNWQIIVGVFCIIGGFGNLTNDFFTFIFGIVIGALLLYWGLYKKGYIKARKLLPPSSRTLQEEDFKAAGVNYYSESINKLAYSNPDWKLSAKQIINNGKVEKKIFRYNYVNKPTVLKEEPDNENDPNAVAIYIAGELVGYISRDYNVHVKDILHNHEIKSISGFIGGGEYKIVTAEGGTNRFDSSFSVNIRIKYI